LKIIEGFRDKIRETGDCSSWGIEDDFLVTFISFFSEREMEEIMIWSCWALEINFL